VAPPARQRGATAAPARAQPPRAAQAVPALGRLFTAVEPARARQPRDKETAGTPFVTTVCAFAVAGAHALPAPPASQRQRGSGSGAAAQRIPPPPPPRTGSRIVSGQALQQQARVVSDITQSGSRAPLRTWRATGCAAARCRRVRGATEPHPKLFKLCRKAAYCCTAHSKEDWKRHKREDGCNAADD
jgi:hypothetical protein